MQRRNNNLFRYSIIGAVGAAALVIVALISLNFQLTAQTRTIDANLDALAFANGSTFGFNRGVRQLAELRRLIVEGASSDEIALAYGIASARLRANQLTADNPTNSFSEDQRVSIDETLLFVDNEWSDITSDIEAGFEAEYTAEQIARIDQALLSISGALDALAVEIDTPRTNNFNQLIAQNATLLTTTQTTLFSVAGLSVLLTAFLVTGAVSLRQAAQQREQALTELQQLNDELEDRVDERTAELSIAKQEAENANKAKSTFLSSMSHELRTPLNAIINFTGFVADGDFGSVNDEQKEFLGNVIHSGKHLLSLINDVLDMSKIEAGSLELYCTDNVDVNKIIRELRPTIVVLTKESGVVVRYDLADDVPPLYADRQRLAQVLLNLLSNAAKFTEKGEIHITTKREGDAVLITVRDSGMGIAQEEQDLIFVPFRQTSSGLQRGGGTGLGLPITKTLVEAHNGHIWFESEHGKGTVFFISLPITVRQKETA